MSPDRAMDPPVGFAEVADFHIAIARGADPELARAALLVGGDPGKRGKVVAASATLVELGIGPGMAMAEALDRAPEARWVRTDMRRAREMSGALRAAVRREVDAVELEGLAGFYMRAPADRDEGLAFGRRLADRVAEETGLSLRVGIAPARFAARMAAEDAGSAGVHVIAPEDFEAYLLRQPLERLPAVGPKTAARLAELGATDVPGLRALGLERLEILLGNHGRSLWQLACGQDPKPLRVRRQPASLSREETLADSDERPERLATSLGRLADRLAADLRRNGLQARRIALRLTDEQGRTRTRSRSLERAVSDPAELAAAARDLLARAGEAGQGFRRAGLVLRGLEVSGAEDRQLDLF